MTTDWDQPVEQTARQIDDLRSTLKNLHETQNKLKPQLDTITSELNALLSSSDNNQKRYSLVEFPRILKTILTCKDVAAMVYGPDGEMLLYNERAQEMTNFAGEAGAGFYKADGATPYPEFELPWHLCLQGKITGDTELLVKHPGKDRPSWVRVSTTLLKDEQTGTVGGVVAFLVDISEHVAIVNELTHICRELEQKLDRMTIAHKELEMLSTKLAQVRAMDLALERDS